MPLHTSSLLFLVGGGRSPRYPPNKVILWDDALAQEVAELEFRERVRGLACRRGWLAVALRRRVVVFQVGEAVARYGEWDTCDNPRGERRIRVYQLEEGVYASRCVRLAHDRHRCVFYVARDTWPADGTHPARTLAPLSSRTTHRTSCFHTATKTTSRTDKASSVHHRRTHDRS